MIIVSLLISIISIFVSIFFVFSVYRLNNYITNLESIMLKQNELTENLKQSLNEILVQGALENDGRLKKFMMQKEKNFIYNGNRVEEDTQEF